MAGVLTTGSTVTCGHTPPGLVMPQSGAKLAVGGEPVLVESSIQMIAPGCTPRVQGDVPCSAVGQITAGRSAKLSVGGAAVMLATLGGTTKGASGTPGTIGGVLGSLTVKAVQSKLAAS
jgi:hypothetical protein